MTQNNESQNLGRDVAREALLLATKSVANSLPTFSNWLLAASGAAFSLVIVNIQTVSKFVAITHIKFGVATLLISLGFAVVSAYLSTMVNAALDAESGANDLGQRLKAQTHKLDVESFQREYEAGLLPPIRWIAKSAMNKAKAGDVNAGVRMLSKLSQTQALFVVVQSLLAIISLGSLVAGLKM